MPVACAVLEQNSFIRKCVDAMTDLATDVNLVFTKSGIGAEMMDSSHVSLISFMLPESQMLSYKFDFGDTTRVGVNLANLNKALRCGGNDDQVTITVDDDLDSIKLAFEAPGGSRSSDLSLKLIDLDTDTLQIPDYDSVCSVKTPAGDFQKTLRNLASIGDHVVISVAAGEVKLTTKGDIGAASVVLKNSSADDDAETVIQCSEPVSMQFSLRYLVSFTKATPLSTNVELKFTPDMPLCMHYSLMDGDGRLDYYLAPKIDEEMEE